MHRLKWIFKTATGQMVPGSGADKQALTAIYAFCSIGGSAVFYEGTGTGGRVLSRTSSPATGADRDNLDSNGGISESANGVYCLGSGSYFGVLVDESCREAP